MSSLVLVGNQPRIEVPQEDWEPICRFTALFDSHVLAEDFREYCFAHCCKTGSFPPHRKPLFSY